MLKYEVYVDQDTQEPRVIRCLLSNGKEEREGIAICSELDEFNFQRGAEIALGRAKKTSEQDYPIIRLNAYALLNNTGLETLYKGAINEIQNRR